MWNLHPGMKPGAPQNATYSADVALEMKRKAEESAQRARLNQVFNTALVSSRSESHPDSAREIQALMDTPAFGAILQSIQLLAGEQGHSEMDAAREVIRTFRKMESLWTEYLVAEGVNRLQSP